MRLYKSHNLSRIKLYKSHNPFILRANLAINSDIKPICKLVKSLIDISSKVYKLKTYDKAINNLIYRNK